MLSFLIRLVLSAAALFFIAGASQGTIQVKSAGAAIIAALVLGIANALVKPILMFVAGILTLPLSCITLGLWNLVLSLLLNAALFYGAGQLLEGFEVRGFWPAILGAIAMSIVNSLASALFSEKDKDRG
ncbi:MAG TPA: phage holin family protein [Abditibacterium sp.]|jgi:putative membrane protein